MEDNEAAKSIAWSLFHACTRSKGPHYWHEPTNPFNNHAYCTAALRHWNSGICIQDSIPKYGHPLYIVARLGNLVMVKNLLSAGADVNAECGTLQCLPDGHESFNRTALHAAAYRGHLAVVKVLVEHDECDINRVNMPTQRDQLQKCAKPLTPLAYAVAYNHVSIVKFLLRKGADTSVDLVTPHINKDYPHRSGPPDCEAARVVALAQFRWTAQAHPQVLQATTLPEDLAQHLLYQTFIY
jgi:hypothetical protein